MTKKSTTDILESNPKGFLLDASGVIYGGDNIPFKGVKEIITKFQKKGPVYIVTNNAFHTEKLIRERLLEFGIDIEEKNILSSGSGLSKDPIFQKKIENKNVFIFGSPYSHHHVEKANPKAIVETLEKADIIVMTSVTKESITQKFEDLFTYCNHTKKTILCCNPDQIIRVASGHANVVGHYAKKLETELHIPIEWIGKPFKNFSTIVKNEIKKQIDKKDFQNVWFFDDNLENVRALEKDIQIQGAWVTETGIMFNKNTEKETSLYGNPKAIIKTLADL